MIKTPIDYSGSGLTITVTRYKNRLSAKVTNRAYNTLNHLFADANNTEEVWGMAEKIEIYLNDSPGSAIQPLVDELQQIGQT